MTLTSDAPSCDSIFAEVDRLGFEPEEAICTLGVHSKGVRPVVGLPRGFGCKAMPFDQGMYRGPCSCEMDVLFVRKDVRTRFEGLRHGNPQVAG